MTKSIVKWAGGKSWAIPRIREMISEQHVRTFVDPFCGSCVVPLNIEADNIIINDFDIWLINVYRMLKNRPRETWSVLRAYIEAYNDNKTLEGKSEIYYAIRNDFNKDIANFRLGLFSAARFIFLNKTCFNGMCRFNKKGLFNSPWGKRMSVKLPDIKHIDELCDKFNHHMSINCGDFEDCCDWDSLGKEDLVFIDSPYVCTWTGYTENGFGMEEHERVARLFERLAAQGVRVIATNSTDEWVLERYKNFNIEIVDVRHNINRRGNERNAKEAIITANIV